MTGELPYTNNAGYINKKDSWLVWKTENGKIANFKIYERNEQNEEEIFRILKNYQPFHDIGNVLSYWSDMSLADILYRLCFLYGFKDKEIQEICWNELMRINEFNEEMNWRRQIDDS